MPFIHLPFCTNSASLRLSLSPWLTSPALRTPLPKTSDPSVESDTTYPQPESGSHSTLSKTSIMHHQANCILLSTHAFHWSKMKRSTKSRSCNFQVFCLSFHQYSVGAPTNFPFYFCVLNLVPNLSPPCIVSFFQQKVIKHLLCYMLQGMQRWIDAISALEELGALGERHTCKQAT